MGNHAGTGKRIEYMTQHRERAQHQVLLRYGTTHAGASSRSGNERKAAWRVHAGSAGKACEAWGDGRTAMMATHY
ncbi:hypothetical protein GCM10022212_29070 [Actimicrobium antarcticum]|uniref:Uncharacterized protein n=1 Tax=Actimicrobium antarcticum TaxID=1051899 RepID=A0ABP7TNU7_9BURK